METKFLSRIVSLVACCMLTVTIGNCRNDINIVVLAPSNETYSFCLKRITPALNIAIEKSQSPKIGFNLIPIDSHFPDEISMWTEANEFIYNKTASMILGPMYDYAVELLARVSALEDIVIISPGGFGVNLGVNKKVDPIYSSLIRITSTMHKLIYFIQMLIIDEYRYEHIKFISEKHDSSMFFCRQFDEALKYIMNMEKNERPDRFDFDLYMFPKEFEAEDILRNEVGNDVAGKILPMTS